MRLRITLPLLVALMVTNLGEAAPILSFEFNTAGDDESWQHNGATNGGSSDITGPTAVTAGSGEGVLTAQQAPGNGDLRVLYNPDLALPASFSSWSTVDVRFRQLDSLNGAPQALAGSLPNMHLGVNSGLISINGTGFVEETPGDTEFWYTASLDISSLGTNDITQIRFDPITSTALDYQLDYARLSGVPAIPEPGSLAIIGVAFASIVTRSRRRD